MSVIETNLQILWAANYFPKWIQAMNDMKAPYAWIPGYQLTVTNHRPWSFVPILSPSRVGLGLDLSAAFCADDGDGWWAVPEFRE
jgi:hypothetical protein